MAVAHRRRLWKNIGVASIHSVLRFRSGWVWGSWGGCRQSLPTSSGVWGALWALPAGSGAKPQPKLNLVHFSQKKIWHPVTIQMTKSHKHPFTAVICACACMSSQTNTVLYHKLLTPYFLTSLMRLFKFPHFLVDCLSLRALSFAPALPLRQKSWRITDTKIVQRITTK